ncbi:MAG: hypothetical protein IPL26_07890 [Leptospiraceae bacterium]|nr:hypothetical protein [Leptospiraceae bacterium]
MEKVQTLQDGKLIIEIEELQNLIKITWLGECTSKNPSEFLNPILNEQYKLCLQKNKQMVLNFKQTKYMNSAGIIPIIRILKIIRDERGSVQVRFNISEKWQTVLIGELKIFETEDNRVQILGTKD